MRTIWIILVLAMACSANAGPWLRPEGEGFMSADSFGSIGRDQGDLTMYSGIFLEYGLTNATTIGLSGGLDHLQNGNATVYFRKALPRPNSRWKMSYEIGLGGEYSPLRRTPHLRLGLSAGQGSLFKDASGWAHIDTWLTIRSDAAPTWKVEATLGKRGAKDWLYLLQVFSTQSSDTDWQFEIAPAIAVPLARKRHLQLGISASTQDRGRFGLKVSLWRAF